MISLMSLEYPPPMLHCAGNERFGKISIPAHPFLHPSMLNPNRPNRSVSTTSTPER